tara:strand:- start:20182 stop:20883 length:702 start_codon:yes stop_codon:yes gene_type:complete
MFYKLSNTAPLKGLEKEFGLPFKFPGLYTPAPVLNGLREVQLPVITMERPSEVGYGIWGLLPKEYSGEWEVYQRFSNTLNKDLTSISSINWHSELLSPKRCLILVTGYFISHLSQGRLYPFYVHMTNNRPFALGGIYTVLEDGFTTFSLLIGNGTNGIPTYIQNLEPMAPLVIDKENRKNWLDLSANGKNLHEMNDEMGKLDLVAHPIREEMSYENGSYERLGEEPVVYRAVR